MNLRAVAGAALSGTVAGWEWLPTEALDRIGTVGLVVFAFWMMSTGRLLTRREAQNILDDRDAWRKTALEALDDNRKLTIAAEVSALALSRIPAPNHNEAGDEQ